MRPETDAGDGRSHASRELEDRWTQIQSQFVDDPRRSAQEATALVRDELKKAMERLSAVEQRVSSLPEGVASTEELRLCVQSLHRIAADLMKL